MVVVEKKCWPEFFWKISNGEKNCEFRLADFSLNPGDTLVLKEFDPATQKFTGRELRKKCKIVTLFNPVEMYKPEDMKKFGCYLIEFEK